MSTAEQLALALEKLTALVWGECPSLLNEDSGGNGTLAIEIEDALLAYRSTPADGGGQGVTPLTESQLSRLLNAELVAAMVALVNSRHPDAKLDSTDLQAMLALADEVVEQFHSIGTPASTGGEHAD